MIKLIMRKLCNRETIFYLICGILTTIIGIAVFWICERAELYVAMSNTISTAAAVSFAYFANKIFVFRSDSWAMKTVAREVFSFIAGRFTTYLMETLLLVLLVSVIGLPGTLCKIFTTGLVVVGNYLISKKIVFVSASAKQNS